MDPGHATYISVPGQRCEAVLHADEIGLVKGALFDVVGLDGRGGDGSYGDGPDRRDHPPLLGHDDPGEHEDNSSNWQYTQHSHIHSSKYGQQSSTSFSPRIYADLSVNRY